MKPMRSRLQNKNGVKQKNGPKESMEVYCRVRPISVQNVELCLKVDLPSTIVLTPPPSYINRNGATKEMQYTFKKVFEDKINQNEIFETVALPLVENLLNGKNGLLFTYGVTGSGKTHTMIGKGKDGGIMPRCIDTIFNSIGLYKTSKYVFKPDRLNGFDIQSEGEAIIEVQQEIITQSAAKSKQQKLERKDSDQDLFKRTPTETKITNIDTDNAYAVFVTFVEIYNNSVYDLLEETNDDGFRQRGPQVKIIREDSDHKMFVHGVNEIEVSTAEEAFEAFYRGKKRRRIAHTALNAESSRAHTIFTVRVVQAPIDDKGQNVILDKKYVQIGQLSLVDLAGSERSNRTNSTGERRREAGNINNSLMTLRSCLELLRENQKGANKLIPYRESRLTHLFKSYFEGEGQVCMIVCVNPHGDDYDENLHVLKFAEISQEVQISCPSVTPKINHAFTPGRRRQYNGLRKFESEDEMNKENPLPVINGCLKPYEIFADIPSLQYVSVEDDNVVERLQKFLKTNLQSYETLVEKIQQKNLESREMILKIERAAFSNTQNVESLKSLYEREKERTSELESQIKNSNTQMCSLKRKMDECEFSMKKLKRELSEKDLLLSKNKLDTVKVKEHYNSKIAETQEKFKSEIERRLRSQKSALEFETRSRERKLREAKRVLSDEALRVIPSTPTPAMERYKYTVSTPSVRPPSPNFRSTGRKLVNVRRARRSRSADTWLEHRPPAPLPLPTLLQPVIRRRKSVTKLTDAKDMVTGGVDRYCLVTQGQDSDGDLEARIYKGDVVPTTGGGVQVQFSDVEILKQKSPVGTPIKRNKNQ